jgi:tetratricopeptide (TPR) repeat protein
MQKMLVWSAMVMLLLAACLAPETCRAQSQAQKLLEQGAGQMEKKQFDQAIATFKKALQEEPRSAVTYNLLGMAYRLKYNQVRSQDLKNQEIAAFKKAIEIDPNYWVALINLGATYYYMGEKAKAAPLFKKALSLNPNNPEKAQLEKMIQEGEKKP